MFKVRNFFRVAPLLFLMALATTAANAQSDAPSGKVSIETTSIAAGIGLSWGHGKLNFNGREYRFSIDGVTLIDFGISKSSAVGEVYNLTDMAKFEGNYVAAEASFALGGGMGGVALRNSNGVIMHLSSVSQGARLQLGSSGMNIKLW
ncbi:MAG TPA: DUF1134 domain-containing protein [Candidatus Binatia bacterium]